MNGGSRTRGFDDSSLAAATRVLAIASGGGHWVQLLRMRPAWEGCDTAYATTHADYEKDIYDGDGPPQRRARFYRFPDANRWQKWRLVWQFLVVVFIVARERPDVVISTGASAGYFALRVAKLFRRRTIWVDSIANAEELSLAGKKVERFADLWLTQWAHLCSVAPNGLSTPRHYGGVL